MHAAYKTDCQLFTSKKGNKTQKLNQQALGASSFQNKNNGQNKVYITWFHKLILAA